MNNLLNRRKFIAKSANTTLASTALFTLNSFSHEARASTKATAKNVIYLYMSGGMSHLDTFDPKPGKQVQGPTKTIETKVKGMEFSEYLPGLAQHADKLAVINSMFSHQGAHEEGRYFMHSSYTKRGTIVHPGLGSWLMKLDGKANPMLPGVVHIGNANPGSSKGYFEQEYAPLLIGDPEAGLQNSKRNKNINANDFSDIIQLTDKLNKKFNKNKNLKALDDYQNVYADAVELMSSSDLEAFDITKEPEYLRKAYGKTEFSEGCLLARRLVEHGVRFVEVTLGGWDTHTNNFERVEAQANELDQAMTTLLIDLEQRGMLRDTLVVLTTEFGRTPKINANEGRDHSPTAFSSVLAGGGIKGGQKFGQSDGEGKFVVENKVKVPDFNATIAHALGLPLQRTVYSDSGRPFHVADKGKPILSLFERA